MKIIVLTMSILVWITADTAFAAQMYYAKVLKVDSNNVIHVGKDGIYSAINLAYLSTPVKGEPLHEQANSYLSERLVGEWVRVTEVSYGGGALVKPSLIRLYDNTMINVEILKEGFALPNLQTNPPNTLLKYANEARQSEKGIWKHLQEFSRARYKSGGIESGRLFGDMLSTIQNAKANNVKPLILDKKTMLAYPFECLLAVKDPKPASTQYVAEHLGYTLVYHCPKAN